MMAKRQKIHIKIRSDVTYFYWCEDTNKCADPQIFIKKNRADPVF